MAIVPKPIDAKLNFWSTHTAVWTGQEAVLGLTAAQTAELATLLADAETARSNQLAALSAAKAATGTLDNALKSLDDFGAGLILAIKTKAETTNDPEVYNKAEIPAPAQPTPAGIPPVPTGVTAQIDTDGNVDLAWVGSTKYNTSFQVTRRLNGETTWTVLGTVVGKKYKDTSVPVGAQSASYKIFAVRSAGMSAGSEPGHVVFGSQQMAA